MAKTQDQMLLELHQEYLEQVNETGIPIWVLDQFGAVRPLNTQELLLDDQEEDTETILSF